MPFVFGLEPDLDDARADVLVSSTSAHTATATPIVLQQTEQVRLRFLPILVDNSKDGSKSVSGKFVYERKGKNDSAFPSEVSESDPVSRNSIRSGDYLSLTVDTSQTHALFEGLKSLYQLYEEMGGIPYGDAGFVRVDNEYRQFSRFVQDNPAAAQMIARPENVGLVKTLLRLITQAESIDSLRQSLAQLEEGSIQRLTSSLSLSQIDSAIAVMEANMGNGDEEYWQKHIFGKYQWVLSQLFSCPCTVFDDKAYVGGKSIGNAGGNVCDFIYQNGITQNVALVEIKTPLTRLLGGAYRQTYSLSNELSGATNQVLNYRDNLLKEFNSLARNTPVPFEAFSPKCVIIIGNTEELEDSRMIGAFENYRNNLNGVSIIAYNELIQRLRELKAVFERPSEEAEAPSDFSDVCPF